MSKICNSAKYQLWISLNILNHRIMRMEYLVTVWRVGINSRLAETLNLWRNDLGLVSISCYSLVLSYKIYFDFNDFHPLVCINYIIINIFTHLEKYNTWNFIFCHVFFYIDRHVLSAKRIVNVLRPLVFRGFLRYWCCTSSASLERGTEVSCPPKWTLTWEASISANLL